MLALLLPTCTSAFYHVRTNAPAFVRRAAGSYMGPQLHGSQQCTCNSVQLRGPQDVSLPMSMCPHVSSCLGLMYRALLIAARSPLVNWYALEAGIEIEMQPPRPSNHPFQQVPFLTDDDGVEVFESGAILLYLADAYGKASTPQERAAYTKWVVWSNSELDGLCFGAVPGDHRVR